MHDSITPDSLIEAVAHAPPVYPAHPPMVDERYEIIGVLGEGGFGVVYDAFDRKRDRRVALKSLRAGTAARLVRLKREFRALVDVSHPNLVELYELSGAGDEIYFTMQRVEGAVPFDVWASRGERELRQALAQLLSGISELHRRGLVHRDIKPSNVLVGADGGVVIVDFGLARPLDLEDETRPAGTPRYMAPEQHEHGSVPTSAVDAYALGVMLFECLAGRAPFEGGRVAETRAKQLGSAPPLLSVQPAAPPDLAHLVDRLLAIEPSDRPAIQDLLPEPSQRARVGPSLIGRAEPLARLRAIAAAGEVRLVEILGPAGIGKSALMEAFLEQTRGALVLRGRCHPREHITYNAFDALMDQLAAAMIRHPELISAMPRDSEALCRLFPTMRPFAPTGGVGRLHPRREHGLRACRELFQRLGDQIPVVLAIDDLQWGDTDSAALMLEVLREPDSPRVLLVATRRSDEAGDLVTRLGRATMAGSEVVRVQLSVGPLPERDAIAMARALITDESRAQSAARESGGRPSLIQALSLREEASDLRELSARRLERLSAPARRRLESISLAGSPLAPELLRALFDEPSLEELLDSGLVRAGPDGVRPFEHWVAEMVVASLSPEERQGLHRRLADAMIEGGADAAHVVGHLVRAEDPRASDYLLRAARQAAEGLRFRSAASFYAELLERVARGDSVALSELHLQEAHAESLAAAGEPGRSSSSFLAAARLVQGDDARRLTCLAAEQLARTGDVQGAWMIFNRVFAQWGGGISQSWPLAGARILADTAYASVRRRLPPSPTSRRRRARLDGFWAAFGALGMVRPLEGASVVARYRAEAESLDDPLHRFRAEGLRLYLQSFRVGARGWAERRAQLAEAHSRCAASTDDPRAELSRLLFAAVLDASGLRSAASVESAEAACDLATELGEVVGFEAMGARVLLANAFQILGDVPRHHVLAARLSAEGDALDHPMITHLGLLQHMGVALLRHGDGPRVEALMQACEKWTFDENQYDAKLRQMADVRAAQGRGDPDTAARLLRRGRFEAWKARRTHPRIWTLMFEDVRRGQIAIARAAKHGDTALLEEAEQCMRTLRAEPSPDTFALALSLEAGIASVRGDDEATRRALRAVCATAESAGMVLLLALARMELSVLDGDPLLGEQAQAFFEASGIRDPIHAARVALPGVFHVTGRR